VEGRGCCARALRPRAGCARICSSCTPLQSVCRPGSPGGWSPTGGPTVPTRSGRAGLIQGDLVAGGKGKWGRRVLLSGGGSSDRGRPRGGARGGCRRESAPVCVARRPA
jgi:hypothetical protein